MMPVWEKEEHGLDKVVKNDAHGKNHPFGVCVWTYLAVGHQVMEEAFLPVDFLENVQTLPSLTSVVRHLHVLAIKEQSVRAKLR